MENRTGAYSQFKVFHHHDRLDMLDRGERCAPIYIRIKPTNVCNHNCYYCTYATGNSVNRGAVDRTDSIPWPKMQEILQDMGDMGVKAVTFSGGGEPLIHPEVTKILYSMHEMGLDIGIFSNGARLNQEVRKAVLDTCTFIRLSINGSNSAEHETVHRVKGDFEKIVENVRSLV